MSTQGPWGLVRDIPNGKDWDIREHVEFSPVAKAAVQSNNRLLYKKYQRNHGSCTGFMIERGMRMGLKKAGQPDIDLSPLFAYFNNRLESGLSTTQDVGATIRGSVDAARKYGLCREAYWTYANADGYLNVKPEAYAYQDALDHQVLEAYTLQNNVDMIRAALADGFGVCYGTSVHRQAFEQAPHGNVTMPNNNDPIDGAHALVLDTHNDSTGRFGFPNYWLGWGDDGQGGDGFGTLPYEHVGKFGFDFWAIRVVESPSRMKHSVTVATRLGTTSSIEDAGRITVDGVEVWRA